MSYNQQMDSTRSVVVNLSDLINVIQDEMGEFIRAPETGLYLPDELEPVLLRGNRYYYEEPKQVQGYRREPVRLPGYPNARYGRWEGYREFYEPVTDFEDVPFTPCDIVEMYDTEYQLYRLVLPHYKAKYVRPEPTIPVMEIKIAHRLLQNEVNRSLAYAKPADLMESIFHEFMRSRYRETSIEDLRRDYEFQESMNTVHEAMADAREALATILRGNNYRLCTTRVIDHYTVSIETQGDYRVKEWERIQADPEYEKWRVMKESGEWDRFLESNERKNR